MRSGDPGRHSFEKSSTVKKNKCFLIYEFGGSVGFFSQSLGKFLGWAEVDDQR